MLCQRWCRRDKKTDWLGQLCFWAKPSGVQRLWDFHAPLFNILTLLLEDAWLQQNNSCPHLPHNDSMSDALNTIYRQSSIPAFPSIASINPITTPWNSCYHYIHLTKEELEVEAPSILVTCPSSRTAVREGDGVWTRVSWIPDSRPWLVHHYLPFPSLEQTKYLLQR